MAWAGLAGLKVAWGCRRVCRDPVIVPVMLVETEAECVSGAEAAGETGWGEGQGPEHTRPSGSVRTLSLGHWRNMERLQTGRHGQICVPQNSV